MTRLAFALIVLAGFQLVAAPAGALTLRQPVTVASELVRVGDFFPGTSRHGDIALFHAPAPGTTGTISAARLEDAVRGLGLDWSAPTDLRAVVVHRDLPPPPGIIDRQRIEEALSTAIAAALPGTLTPDDIAITRLVGASEIALATMPDADVQTPRIEIDAKHNRFNATLEVIEPTIGNTEFYTGSFEIYREVAVLTAPVDRGQIVTPDLVDMQRLRGVPETAETDLAAVVGLAARRRLREGTTLSTADLEEPKVIARNQLVTITFELPGMLLTTEGRALAAAAIGEPVSVINIRSKRTIQAVAIGEGRVAVATSPAQLAMR